MAEENTTEKKARSRRQGFVDRYKRGNPDLDYDDDEVLDEQIANDLDGYDKLKKDRDSFNELLANPENEYAAPIITGVMTGKNPDGSPFDLQEWFLDNEPDLVFDLADGNPDVKKNYEARREQRRKDEEEARKWAAERDKNIEKEDKELDAAIEQEGYKPEDVEGLLDWIYNKETGLLKRAQSFELTKDDFVRLFRMKDYDAKVRKAEDDGYVRGRNEKIDMNERREGRRNKMPVISGGGRQQPKEDGGDPMLDALDKMGKAYRA